MWRTETCHNCKKRQKLCINLFLELILLINWIWIISQLITITALVNINFQCIQTWLIKKGLTGQFFVVFGFLGFTYLNVFIRFLGRNRIETKSWLVSMFIVLITCWKKTNFQFHSADATIEFVQLISDIFDIMNSKNPISFGLKAPLRELNVSSEWQQIFEKACSYLLDLMEKKEKFV